MDAGPPYTLEDLNRLTGTRAHRRATTYSNREEAESAAINKTRRMRDFMRVNVLDRRGDVVASFAGGSGNRENPWTTTDTWIVVGAFFGVPLVLGLAGLAVAAAKIPAQTAVGAGGLPQSPQMNPQLG